MTDFSPLSSQSQPLEPLATPLSADALDPSEEPAADVPTPPLYDYGSSMEVPAGYVSDADLLAWLQAKSSGQYGELDRLMDTSNARSKLVKDLSHLKETLADAGADPQAALAEIEAVQAAYAGTPHAEEIDALVGPMRDKIQSYVDASASVDATAMDAPNLDDREIARMKNELKAKLAAEFGSFTGSVDATIKDLEHDDQLALVQIQALMSEIRESTQLTSNILANRSQTSDSIVGNIRA